MAVSSKPLSTGLVSPSESMSARVPSMAPDLSKAHWAVSVRRGSSYFSKSPNRARWSRRLPAPEVSVTLKADGGGLYAKYMHHSR